LAYIRVFARSAEVDSEHIPGRGWAYNIWGFGCVKLTLSRKIIRFGTDDAEDLAKVVGEKIGSRRLPVRFGQTVQEVLPQVRPVLTAWSGTTTFRE
jgi:hypothetical protein